MAEGSAGKQGQFLYIFLDEAGDFNFSPTGTRYFALTSLTKRRPFEAYKALTELKYDFIEMGRELLVVTDRIPVSRKREAVEKAVKQTLAELLPKEVRYQVLHHASKSNLDLQIVDYCNWAIYRKWDRQDFRSYEAIRSAVMGESDIFASETARYY